MRREELEAKSKAELLELARKLDVPGRSQLSKDGLVRALLKRSAAVRPAPFSPRTPAGTRKVGGQRAATPRGARPKQTRSASAAQQKSSAAAAPKKAAARATRTSPSSVPAKKAISKTPAPKAVRTQSAARSRGTAPQERAARRAEPAPGAAQRGGPFGPASEKLHGAVIAPPAGEARGNGRPGPRTTLGAPLAMPERYGRDYAALMVRDPYWLHTYWEVTSESVEGLRRRLGSDWDQHRWVMRVFAFPPGIEPTAAEEGNGEDFYDIELPFGASSWFINVGRPDRVYRIAVGVLTRSGKFHALARSNAVRTPRDSYSLVTDEEWTTLPETFRLLYEMTREAGAQSRSSAELGLLLRERLRADWSSGMLGSMASGALVRREGKPAGFWFVLDAELIVYGATEPDATVTVQGRPIELRPDGTFTLRFQLPDGTQVIDATAVSADGVFRKTITPTVRRETRATEMIEAQVES